MQFNDTRIQVFKLVLLFILGTGTAIRTFLK